MFQLHPTLATDSIFVGNLTLCEVRLNNNHHYTWLILVPRRKAIREIYELSQADQIQLLEEINWVTKKLANFTQADKMNTAAFGNMVPQLHLHVIARHTTDKAWPQPVWAAMTSAPYPIKQQTDLIKQLQLILALNPSTIID